MRTTPLRLILRAAASRERSHKPRAARRSRNHRKRSSEESHDILYRHRDVPPRRCCEGHWRGKICRRIQRAGLVYGSIVTSTIAKGRITRIDTSAAMRVEGVIDVLTHENRPPMADNDQAYKDDIAPALV